MSRVISEEGTYRDRNQAKLGLGLMSPWFVLLGKEEVSFVDVKEYATEESVDWLQLVWVVPGLLWGVKIKSGRGEDKYILA